MMLIKAAIIKIDLGAFIVQASNMSGNDVRGCIEILHLQLEELLHHIPVQRGLMAL